LLHFKNNVFSVWDQKSGYFVKTIEGRFEDHG